MRREQEPVPVEGLFKNDPTSKAYNHPAFGQIRANRWQGGGVGGGASLYGSDFQHNAGVHITISRSQLNRDLHRDWHVEREQVVEVNLSEAQWATFVSSLNLGSGVPCTIEYVGGENMPSIPPRNERDVMQKELDERVQRVAGHLNAAIADIEANLAGLSKAKRDTILGRVRLAQREVADSMPFAAKSFAEHMEEVVEKAKIEVGAYVQQTIVRAGLQALGAPPPLALGDTGLPPEAPC